MGGPRIKSAAAYEDSGPPSRAELDCSNGRRVDLPQHSIDAAIERAVGEVISNSAPQPNFRLLRMSDPGPSTNERLRAVLSPTARVTSSGPSERWALGAPRSHTPSTTGAWRQASGRGSRRRALSMKGVPSARSAAGPPPGKLVRELEGQQHNRSQRSAKPPALSSPALWRPDVRPNGRATQA